MFFQLDIIGGHKSFPAILLCLKPTRVGIFVNDLANNLGLKQLVQVGVLKDDDWKTSSRTESKLER